MFGDVMIFQSAVRKHDLPRARTPAAAPPATAAMGVPADLVLAPSEPSEGRTGTGLGLLPTAGELPTGTPCTMTTTSTSDRATFTPAHHVKMSTSGASSTDQNDLMWNVAGRTVSHWLQHSKLLKLV